MGSSTASSVNSTASGAGGSTFSLCQPYRGGEKVFVDYPGPTQPIVGQAAGEIREAQMFVGALGASNYTFFSLSEARRAYQPLVEALNRRPFQKMEGSRMTLFEELDRPALRPHPRPATSSRSGGRFE